MAAITDNSDFVRDLIRALGLPPNMRSFEVRVAAGNVVLVRAEIIPQPPTADDAGRLITVTKQYELHEQEVTGT